MAGSFFVFAIILLPQFGVPCRGMLISLENSSGPVSSGIGGVLSSRESPALPVKFILRQETALVSWEENSGASLVVRGKGGLPDPLDLEILKIISRENIRSVQDYARWLESNFTYQKHEGADYWAPARQTLSLRRGDCKDLSLLNAAFLRVLGYRPSILAMARIADSHAICVFRKDGRYFWFDNTRLRETSASSLSDFKEYIHKYHQMYFMYEVNAASVEGERVDGGKEN